MKLFPKRLAALLLAAVMTLSLFPATGFAADKDAQEPEKDEPFYGYRATPHAGTHALTDAYLRGEGASVNYFNPGQPVNDLPAKYDSRDYGYITSVKNQNPYGSCWAHAAMASVESYMIKHGIPVGTGAAATTSLNLSETQHCFFTFAGAYDAEGMIEGDKATLQGDNCLDSGGNGELSAYTLMRWNGAADETVSALAYGSASSVAYNGLGSQYAYQYNDCHVQNTVWIPGTNVEAIKQAIMEYGAGNISYYEGSQGTYICNIPTSETYANHAITVVGWDDTVAVSKFRPDTPQNPGAWICKNSWGTGQFDNGYCYISYEDTTMNSDYIYFYDAEPIDNYEHNYQYDGTSNPVCYGVGWDNAVGYYKGFANDTQVANVFTAKGPEELKAIAFCSWDEDLSYTVEIYKNPTEGNPSSGTLMATKSGSVAFAGYYTIPLDSPVALTTGDTFSVVIKQSAPVADENGTYVHTPYDATFNNSQVVSWCAWTHVDHGPTSYYKEPGGTWKDCPENGDYRIKAFTDDVHFNIEAIANNDAWGSLTVDGTKIIAEPAEGYYVADYEVVSGTATATININTITVAPSSDCTIRVIFAPKPSFTVNFLASGTLEGQQTAQIYDVITLPSSVSVSAEGWSFSGWTDAQLAEETTVKPATYYEPGADYMVFGDTTLYAVFTRVEEGAAEVVYELVNRPEDGGTYILVAASSISGTTGYAVGNTIVSNNHYLTPVAVTINSDDTCSASGTNLPKVLWKVEGSESEGYTFFNEAVSKYMGLDSSEFLAPTATALRWSYTISGSLDNQVDSEGYYYLSFTSTDPMRYTTSKQESAINLYRASDADLTYYWTDPVVGEHVHALQHVESKPAACTEAGNIEHWRCTICGKCFSDAEGQNEIPADSVVIPALNHDWSDWTETTAPTCTENGVETRTCSRCPESENRPINALGHNFGEWTETTAPTALYTRALRAPFPR